jgi:hypothetical protein
MFKTAATYDQDFSPCWDQLPKVRTHWKKIVVT